MATIQIDNLKPSGFDLLTDEESFLHEVSDEQMGLTYGGITPWGALFLAAAALSYKIGRDDKQDAAN
ncbi:MULTISPECIES: hypothetical protein [unclassified Nodularia (in: cyanobacteria)]|uniref:hypothetical protein n=1 Tax=unclassified Nodularia (in: cyanobacteria) TaxID=2656917 RepID=UPI00187E4968|nr:MULTISPECIES: hypothetical protein [unclassified Nodularia (in: cyanobacteria)]MBE9197505.1 hypothetical protein [Nodularia sp. LEGE 06071]MCC2694382.1 hypothetical protein [Nodularia sp. LEGE 04288]